MFLIEYRKGAFIDGEQVNWIEISLGMIGFTINGSDVEFSVDERLQRTFINNLQVLNQNGSVEKVYTDIHKG